MEFNPRIIWIHYYSREDENTLGALVIHSGTQLNIANKVNLNPFPSDLFFCPLKASWVSSPSVIILNCLGPQTQTSFFLISIHSLPPSIQMGIDCSKSPQEVGDYKPYSRAEFTVGSHQSQFTWTGEPRWHLILSRFFGSFPFPGEWKDVYYAPPLTLWRPVLRSLPTSRHPQN